jgi:hypothetical protein
MSGMDGFINFNGTLEGSIAGGDSGAVKDVKTNASGSYQSVVDDAGNAMIDLSLYAKETEVSEDIQSLSGQLANKQNIINYSMEEQLTGRFLNGKPTYIKIFEKLNMSPDTAYDIAVGIDDIILHDICAIIDNKKYYPSNISMYDYQGNGTCYVNVRLFTDTHKLQLLNQSRTNTIGCRTIIEYTKTEV